MGDTRSPVNTTKQVEQAPEMMLTEMLGHGSSAAIERSEAAGQREMLFSDVIPVDGSDALEALGFKLGDVVEGDELFRACELPEGWKREGSNHAMWSYIVDERELRRVAVFYKAAFYDRSAHAHVEREPQTAAQSAAYEPFSDEYRYPEWRVERTMDGDICVLTAHQQEVGEDGQAVYDHDAHTFKRTGQTVEKRIAMDGSET